MAYIQLPDLPGITALFQAYPDSAKPLRRLAEFLLRGPSPLSEAEREIIATHVSLGNRCAFCSGSHAAAARALAATERLGWTDEAAADPEKSPVDERLKALLAIAGKVRQDPQTVRASDLDRARTAGADDRAIHDAVLIAAAFCMFNRYVDGLGTEAPANPADYDAMGERLARQGYAPAEDGIAPPA